MLFKVFILNIGVFSCATAVIMIKASTEHVLLLAAYRQLVAALVLAPLFIRDIRRFKQQYSWSRCLRSVGPGIALGLHFITWNYGARMTLAANASLIVNMVPVVMPFFIFFLTRELVNKKEVVGTIVALAGVFILGTADFHIGQETFSGDLMCFVSMLLFALYLALGRRNRDIPSIWLYLVPLYLTGGIFCLLVSPLFITPFRWYTPGNLLYVLGLGIIPTIVGHSILNFSMKRLRGQVVAIANLGQFVYAGIMAFFCLQEIPEMVFYIAAFFIIIGAVVVIQHTVNKKLT